MAHGLVPPPWLTFNRIIARKLQRKRRLKAKGLAPVPASKDAQRALAASLAHRPATKTVQQVDLPRTSSNGTDR